MSLSRDGVWKAGVWATTVWVQDVWFEGALPPPAPEIVVELPEGGAIARSAWDEERRRRKRVRELEEVELKAFGQAAVEQIIKDWLTRFRRK